MFNQETVTITKEEYERLLDREWFLECLKCQGVDNWQGYGDAQDMYENPDDEF